MACRVIWVARHRKPNPHRCPHRISCSPPWLPRYPNHSQAWLQREAIPRVFQGCPQPVSVRHHILRRCRAELRPSRHCTHKFVSYWVRHVLPPQPNSASASLQSRSLPSFEEYNFRAPTMSCILIQTVDGRCHLLALVCSSWSLGPYSVTSDILEETRKSSFRPSNLCRRVRRYKIPTARGCFKFVQLEFCSRLFDCLSLPRSRSRWIPIWSFVRRGLECFISFCSLRLDCTQCWKWDLLPDLFVSIRRQMLNWELRITKRVLNRWIVVWGINCKSKSAPVLGKNIEYRIDFFC